MKRDVTLNVRLLQVAPFSLKWTFLGKGGARFRPFLTVGGDFIVVISSADPVQAESLQFTGTSPFDATLIGGSWPNRPSWPRGVFPRARGTSRSAATRAPGSSFGSPGEFP